MRKLLTRAVTALAYIAFTFVSPVTYTVPVQAQATATCPTFAPSTSTDLVALQAAADCYGTIASTANAAITSDKAAIASDQAQLANLATSLTAANADISAVQAEIADLQAKLAADQAKLAADQASVTQLASQQAGFNSQIASISSDIDNQTTAAAAATTQQQAYLARITALKTAPPPVTWTHCANENQVCSFGPGTATVRYGANGKYNTKTGVVNSIACTNAAMGPDPIYGVVKSCDYTALVAATTPPPPPPTTKTCPDGSVIPATSTCPAAPPPPPPSTGGVQLRASVTATQDCMSLMNPIDFARMGNTYVVVGFAGLVPRGGTGDAMGPPAGTQDLVVLNDATHKGDGWYGIYVPLGCVK